MADTVNAWRLGEELGIGSGYSALMRIAAAVKLKNLEFVGGKRVLVD